MASNSENGVGGTPPTTPKAAASGYSSLTNREQEILAKAMTCLKTAPEIDFIKLATELGMSNHRSAVNAWAIIKKKMDWSLKTVDGPASGKATAASSSKRKLKAAAEQDAGGDQDEDMQAATPTKKVKAAPKPRNKAPATPKKGKAAAAAAAATAAAVDAAATETSPPVVKDDSDEDTKPAVIADKVKEEETMDDEV